MPFLGGGMGSSEMIIFGVIALLLFGKRLPEVARSVGSSFMEFKKGMQGIQDDVRGATTPSYSDSYTDTAASRPSAIEQNEPEEDTAAPKFELPEA